MKLNKKVLTGALALAMGLGIAAPAVNSFAAENKTGQELVTDDYKKAEEAFVAVFNKNQELKDSIPAKEKAVADAEEAVKEAKDADNAANFVKNTENYIEDLDELKDNSVVVEFNSLLKLKKDKEQDFNDYITEHSAEISELNQTDPESEEPVLSLEEDVQAWLEANQDEKNTLKERYGDKADILMTAVGYAQAANTADKAVSDYRDKYEGYEDKLQDAKDALKEAKDALAYAKGYDSSAEYMAARQAFVDAGGDKAIIDKAEETGVYVPEEKPEEEESVVEKIKAQLAVNKKKLSALEALKEYMPETYKLYKDRVDTAIANAEKAIKKAEDFLAANKKVALFSVAYAAEDGEKTAEEVLKDLQDSEKEMDDVMNDIEKDSKEENDKDDAGKNDDGDKNDGAGKNDDADKKDEPKVEEETDKTPAKNVKTGVAGVAGVGAVLAAASAAYVSSKRK